MGHKLNPLADLSGEQVDFPGPPAAQDDASQVSGQDPQSLFGIPVSYQSGAAGTPAPGGGGGGGRGGDQPQPDPGTGPVSRGGPGGAGGRGGGGRSPPPTPPGGRPRGGVESTKPNR